MSRLTSCSACTGPKFLPMPCRRSRGAPRSAVCGVPTGARPVGRAPALASAVMELVNSGLLASRLEGGGRADLVGGHGPVLDDRRLHVLGGDPLRCQENGRDGLVLL